MMEGFEPLRVIRPPEDDADEDVGESMDEGAVLEEGVPVFDEEHLEKDEINTSLANLVEVLTSDQIS